MAALRLANEAAAAPVCGASPPLPQLQTQKSGHESVNCATSAPWPLTNCERRAAFQHCVCWLQKQSSFIDLLILAHACEHCVTEAMTPGAHDLVIAWQMPLLQAPDWPLVVLHCWPLGDGTTGHVKARPSQADISSTHCADLTKQTVPAGAMRPSGVQHLSN